MGINGISDLMLERYLLNELPAREKKRLDSELESDSNLKKRLEYLKESNDDFFTTYPTEELAPKIKQKIVLLTPDKKKSFNIFKWMGPVMAAALVVLFVFILPPGEQQTTRIKGQVTASTETHPQIFIFRKSSRGIEQLQDKSIASQGELLQIAYLVNKQKHGLIFSIDGNGVLTPHFPEKVGQGSELIQGTKHFLSQSYELDNAPNFERFFFLSSEEPIDIQGIFDTIKKNKKHIKKIVELKKLYPNITVSSILIIKGEKK